VWDLRLPIPAEICAGQARNRSRTYVCTTLSAHGRTCRRLSRSSSDRRPSQTTVVLAECCRVPYDSIMSEAIAFDTHRFVKRLTDCGFTEKQAETLADEYVSLLNGNLATKTDIEALRQATKADIEALRQATKADIKALRLATKADIEALRQETQISIAKVEARIESSKSDLLRWLFGALIAQGGLIVALVKLL